MKFYCLNLISVTRFFKKIQTLLCAALGSQVDGVLGRQNRKLSLGQYDNDVPTQPLYTKCGWKKPAAADDSEHLVSLVSVGETKEVRKN